MSVPECPECGAVASNGFAPQAAEWSGVIDDHEKIFDALDDGERVEIHKCLNCGKVYPELWGPAVDD